jgi:catechol 2,3-dioxygenase-like lactoylglutathione lyase family enzyme
VSALVRVTGLDHIVLRVADVERSLAFYVERLGLVPDRVDEWRAGEVPFPSVRVDATTRIDLFPAGVDAPAGRNLDHCCLVVESTDLAALAASGEVDVAGGPATLYGAQGMGEGLYVRDPDGNVIELRQYGPA